MKNVFSLSTQNVDKFAYKFSELLIFEGLNEPVFLCVGNSNVVGDMFGPLCGEILKNKFNLKNVYGNLTNNITSKNLVKTYQFIKHKHPFNPVVVIDASVSECEEIGTICLEDNACLPAHNVNNVLMGNISVLGKVNIIGVSDFMFLKSVKYKMVLNMANIVCLAIFKGVKLKKIYEKNSNNLCV